MSPPPGSASRRFLRLGFQRPVPVVAGVMAGFANAILGIVKTILPDVLLGDKFKDFKFTFATDQAQRVTAADAAANQRQDINNTIRLQIDADGRPRVKEISAGSDNTTIDVSAGLSMVGA